MTLSSPDELLDENTEGPGLWDVGLLSTERHIGLYNSQEVLTQISKGSNTLLALHVLHCSGIS